MLAAPFDGAANMRKAIDCSEPSFIPAELFAPQQYLRRLLPACAKVAGQVLDLGQIALQFAPSVTERIIRIGVKGALEGAHAVLQLHHKELLLNGRRGVVESQQVRICVSVIGRFGLHAILVQARHHLDSFGQQAVGFLDHLVALG